MSGIYLLASDNRGIYIPKYFAEQYEGWVGGWDNIRAEDLEVCKAGPDHEWYWEAWASILDNATYKDGDGNTWHLMQDGDLWAYCVELFTEEERDSFFHEFFE